ncbi:MAG TPA: MFS transporter [Spirochaetia bacterium]|nr:MFS transporter [Spirochaetia bacterium]
MRHDTTSREGYEWVALSVTTIGALLASIQGSALIIGLPDILAKLGADFLTMIWVLLAYLLVTTAFVPVIGRLADMFGRKRLYNAGFAIFSLGSLFAGLAQARFHGWDLVLARVVQGIGGALLFANSAAIVTDAFRHGRIGLGLGVNQIAVAAGFILGPVVGGLLASIDWRLIFLINVPLGLFGTLWGIRNLREPEKLPGGQHFDPWGSVTFTVGLAALLLGLSITAFPAGPAFLPYALIAFAVVVLTAFALIERRVPEPMLDFQLFRHRLFSFANLAGGLNGLARGAVLFLLTFFLQGPYGKNPLQAGILTAPFGIAFVAVGPLSGSLSDRHGSRGLATAGLLVSSVGLLGLATITATTSYWVLAVFMVLMGGGSGLFSSPNQNAIMSSVVPERRGIASATGVMFGNTGQMFSIAIAFPLVLSHIPQDVMYKIFLYGGGMQGVPTVLQTFEKGLHQAFLVSFAITIVAAAASFLRPSKEEPIAARADLEEQP